MTIAGYECLENFSSASVAWLGQQRRVQKLFQIFAGEIRVLQGDIDH